MYTASIDAAPERNREGMRSVTLLQSGDADSDLAVTWVEIEPGCRQKAHSHPPEQVYVVISGEGLMRIGDESRELRRGELALIPPGVEHGIDNTGADALIYVSAATPTFSVTDLYDSGRLKP
jgi:quercetin dioxygenase-like cupin family protein